MAVEAEAFGHVLCSIHVHRLPLLAIVRGSDRVPPSRSRLPTRGVGLGRGRARRRRGGLAGSSAALGSPLRFFIADPVGLIIDLVLLLLHVHLEDPLFPSCIVDGDPESEARDQAGIIGRYSLSDRADHRASRTGVVEEGGELRFPFHFLEELDSSSRHLQLSHSFLVDFFYCWVAETGSNELAEGDPIGVSVAHEVVVVVVGVGGVQIGLSVVDPPVLRRAFEERSGGDDHKGRYPCKDMPE